MGFHFNQHNVVANSCISGRRLSKPELALVRHRVEASDNSQSEQVRDSLRGAGVRSRDYHTATDYAGDNIPVANREAHHEVSVHRPECV